MKLAALVTSLVLGASSVVAAEGSPAAADSAAVQGAWVALTEPMRLSRGRDVIRLDDRTAIFTQLRFQATRGSSHIERVIVMFLDGTSQTVELDVKLDVDTPMSAFALEGAPRRIDRLIVIGASSRRAAVQLFGV
jgi:hypothetical protein